MRLRLILSFFGCLNKTGAQGKKTGHDIVPFFDKVFSRKAGRLSHPGFSQMSGRDIAGDVRRGRNIGRLPGQLRLRNRIRRKRPPRALRGALRVPCGFFSSPDSDVGSRALEFRQHV